MQDKLLISKCEDLFSQCDKYIKERFTDFLNESESAIIKKEIGNRVGYNVAFFGGFCDAQRTIFGVFPEWEEIDNKKFPIKVIKITKTYKKELTHRDYLGTILSKGIDRSKVGDILVNDNCAYVFISEDIAEFIAFSIDKISNVGVKCEIVEIDDVVIPKAKFEIINTVCASTRLDCIVGAMLNVSRKISSELINAEKVSVNHIEVINTSYDVKEGDIISVRGFGRFVFESVGERTRSQRIHIQVKKFI